MIATRLQSDASPMLRSTNAPLPATSQDYDRFLTLSDFLSVAKVQCWKVVVEAGRGNLKESLKTTLSSFRRTVCSTSLKSVQLWLCAWDTLHYGLTMNDKGRGLVITVADFLQPLTTSRNVEDFSLVWDPRTSSNEHLPLSARDLIEPAISTFLSQLPSIIQKEVPAPAIITMHTSLVNYAHSFE
jgi:hypothetical protein